MALFVGVDVQGDKLIVAFRRNGEFLPPARVELHAERVLNEALRLRQNKKEPVVAAVDAPRFYLNGARQCRLNKANIWENANLQGGRHCEVIVRKLGLANPQWTPQAHAPSEWICLGQKVFKAFEDTGLKAIECFPTASYARLGKMPGTALNVPGEMFAHCRGLAHDVLDSCVAALTTDLFAARNATELGGGDGYGTIVIPGVVEVPYPAFPTTGTASS
jgi:predicted nuclease with RNAse H fold